MIICDSVNNHYQIDKTNMRNILKKSNFRLSESDFAKWGDIIIRRTNNWGAMLSAITQINEDENKVVTKLNGM